MFRAFTAASILVLTVTTAHADPATTGWGARGPQSASDVCGSLLQSKTGSLFYQTWFKSCMRSTGAEIAEIARHGEAKAGQQYPAFASK